MKINKITILASAFAISLTSCNDFLDVKPGDSSDATTVLTKVSDAKSLINGLNKQMVSSNYYGRNFLLYADAKGGDLTVYANGRGHDALYSFNHSATTNNYGAFWSSLYSCINQSNFILEKIAEAEPLYPTQNFQYIKGQAYTARALFYFDLVRLYGKTYTQDKDSYGVPIITSTQSYDFKPTTRNTVAEVYTQIIKDLEEGKALLSSNKASAQGYIDYYTNIAIQSRVYLTMGNYDKAYETSKEIINSNVYKLYSNEDLTRSWSAMFGTESIFELAIYEGESDLGTSSLGYYYMRRVSSQGGMFAASENFIQTLGQDANDVRKNMFGRDEKSASRMGAVYKYFGTVSTGSTSSTINSRGDKGTANYTAVNIKVIRLSEIYLTAAEAALKKSNPDLEEAANLYNAIRKRSPNLALATASTINEDLIIEERRKEFFGEGLRYWDIIRLNKTITFDEAYGGISYTWRPSTINRDYNRTILPIPQSEINANPNLKNQQNPGY